MGEIIQRDKWAGAIEGNKDREKALKLISKFLIID